MQSAERYYIVHLVLVSDKQKDKYTVHIYK